MGNLTEEEQPKQCVTLLQNSQMNPSGAGSAQVQGSVGQPQWLKGLPGYATGRSGCHCVVPMFPRCRSHGSPEQRWTLALFLSPSSVSLSCSVVRACTYVNTYARVYNSQCMINIDFSIHSFLISSQFSLFTLTLSLSLSFSLLLYLSFAKFAPPATYVRLCLCLLVKVIT